ncbi:hypothetical protein ABZ801_01235 [Actinomadura sp. NPDC047616]|uniref:hypothetical protein n=1 Tax=Actinomadura sp. NPDC047616 TaxID=3155914 RepID=UPI003403C954
MGWARIDDGFDDHPKVVELLDHEEEGWAAITLWVMCLTWAHRNTRKPGKAPGHIPPALPRRYLGAAGRAAAELLVEVGLWDAADRGWVIHDFIKYLPSEETRQARAAAGRKGAEARWRGKQTRTSNDGDGGESTSSQEAHGNEPSTSHDSATSGMTNDGSRARARRAPTPDPMPEPEPSSPQSPPHVTTAASTGAKTEPGTADGGRNTEGQNEDRNGAQVIDMGLVAEIQALRPDWSVSSIFRTLEHPDVRSRPWDLVRAAFTTIAADPDTRLPSRLTHDGPWWGEALRQTRPRPARPPWCGQCDAETTRMVELGDGRLARCPDCHPKEVRTA